MQRLAGLLFLICPAAWAQSSASYQLESAHINNAGRPLQGVSAASASHRVTLDAMGEIANAQSTSASWNVGSAFPLRYRPPGEVLGLRFADRDTLQWKPERSVGRYSVYRDLIGVLSSGVFGHCLQSGLGNATVDDATLPAPSQGFFYLVTAKNRLTEEGTMGRGSSTGRANNNPCP